MADPTLEEHNSRNGVTLDKRDSPRDDEIPPQLVKLELPGEPVSQGSSTGSEKADFPDFLLPVGKGTDEPNSTLNPSPDSPSESEKLAKIREVFEKFNSKILDTELIDSKYYSYLNNNPIVDFVLKSNPRDFKTAAEFIQKLVEAKPEIVSHMPADELASELDKLKKNPLYSTPMDFSVFESWRAANREQFASLHDATTWQSGMFQRESENGKETKQKVSEPITLRDVLTRLMTYYDKSLDHLSSELGYNPVNPGAS